MHRMSMFSLVLQNLWAKKGRSLGIAAAIGLAVMTVVTLMVVSTSLETAAAQILTIGRADFSVAQKGVAEVLNSNLTNRDLQNVRLTPGVASAIGVYVATENLNADNPIFIEIGIDPSDLQGFGVRVLSGRPYGPTSPHEVMLGWRAAQNFGLHVGDQFKALGTSNTVVGIYTTGNSFGDSGAMFPLPVLQGYNRVPGQMTLFFVKVEPGQPVVKVQSTIDRTYPGMTTIRTAEQFGRADTNLVFLRAAVTSSTVLAILIGAVIVGNTMLLSLFERTREFGLLRAIGWARTRVVGLVVGEGVILALIGSCLGLLLAVLAVALLKYVPALRGVLHPTFDQSAFLRGLATGLGMAVIGALYPGLRASSLRPLEALSRE